MFPRLNPTAWSVMILSVVLTACGGGGSADAGTDTTTASTGTTTAVAGATATTTGTSSGAGTTTTASAPACSGSAFQAELMRQLNALRAAGADCGSHGVFAPTGPLAWNDQLATAALGHSQDMAANNYFDHTSLDGTTMDQRITAAGYVWRIAAENIAAGQTSVGDVMTGWKNSPGHCANLMDPALQEVGVSCVAGNANSRFGTYWTMDLGAR